MPIQSLNPATGEILKTFQPMTEAEINSKLSEAQQSFQVWKNYTFVQRGNLFKKVAIDLRENKRKYAEIMVKEMGKPITQALGEVEKCAWACEHFADHAEKYLKLEHVQTENTKSYVRFDPLGIVLAVMPWNFPFWQVFRSAAPIMMGGNGYVLKHSSNVPQSALIIEEIFQKAGFPQGIFSTVLVEGSDTEKLIKDPRISAVTVTGSEMAGRQVAKVAGYELKPVVLELGGSDAFIVLSDADIDSTVKMAVTARVQNTGQSCIAAKRFILMKDIAESFLAKFKEEMQKVTVGDPMDESTQMGALAHEKFLQQLDEQVKKSVAQGAEIIIGGKKASEKGAFYEPTIISNITDGMVAYEEELFGPVAVVIVVETEDEAIRVANDTKFGLGASIWTKDIAKAEQMATEIEAGSVFINDFVKSDPRMPIGGIKASGFGRELGVYGMKEFMNVKSVIIK